MAKSTKSRHLIEGIVEALVEVVQVAEDDSLAHLHGDLDPVDVEADLPVFLWQKTMNMITNNHAYKGCNHLPYKSPVPATALASPANGRYMAVGYNIGKQYIPYIINC